MHGVAQVIGARQSDGDSLGGWFIAAVELILDAVAVQVHPGVVADLASDNTFGSLDGPDGQVQTSGAGEHHVRVDVAIGVADTEHGQLCFDIFTGAETSRLLDPQRSDIRCRGGAGTAARDDGSACRGITPSGGATAAVGGVVRVLVHLIRRCVEDPCCAGPVGD